MSVAANGAIACFSSRLVPYSPNGEVTIGAREITETGSAECWVCADRGGWTYGKINLPEIT